VSPDFLNKFKRGHIKAKLEAAKFFVYFCTSDEMVTFFSDEEKERTRQASEDIA
jgi:hypothetical protein